MFGVISIPDAVAAEILRGKDLSDGFASAMDVEDGIGAGWITVEGPDAGERYAAERYSHDPGIHRGEAAVLAMGHRFDLLLLDDLCARTFAKALGFDMAGTIGILLQAYDLGLISFSEFEESLDDLEYHDFWLRPHLKRRIMAEAEFIRQKRERELL
jgi:predicted nucleic acid-binding protein